MDRIYTRLIGFALFLCVMLSFGILGSQAAADIGSESDTGEEPIVCTQHKDLDFNHKCDICGATVSDHIGGQATCTKRAICTICGKEYGELAEHNYENAWSSNSSEHWLECTECGAAGEMGVHISADGSHVCSVCGKTLSLCRDTDSDHLCDICGKQLSDHVGGQATCTERAICTICGKEYGELAEHDYENAWSSNGSEHWLECTECGAAGEMGAHISADGSHVCSVCGKTLSLCRDTDSDHLCDICGKQLSEHSYGEEWCTDGDAHWHECVCKDRTDEASHEFVWITDKDATAAESGSRHEECTVCGYAKAAVEIAKLAPHITNGSGNQWSRGSADGIVFRSDAALSDLIEVLTDGNTVPADGYDVFEGSTVVRLKSSYLKTLTEGKHTLTIRSVGGDATADFTIDAPSLTLPSDPEATRTLLMVTVAAILAILVIVVLVLVCKRNRRRKRRSSRRSNGSSSSRSDGGKDSSKQ